jgi:hypothetical protein
MFWSLQGQELILVSLIFDNIEGQDMKFKIYLSIYLIALIFSITSCGGSAPINNAGNANNSNTNLAGHPPMTTKSLEAETVNNAPTLGPTVQAYYKALENKDDAAVRETLTTDFLKNIETDMKDQHRKDLAAFLAETDYRPGQVIEARNEKIEGDKGLAEIRGGAYKNWTAFTFARENGKWKFTGGSPATDNMPKTDMPKTNSPHR